MKFWRCFPVTVLFALTLNAQERRNDSLKLDDGVQPHAQLDAIYARFSEAYKILDPAMVANLYTEDALYLEPDQPVKRGRPAIQESFAGFFKWARDNMKQIAISFRIVSRQVAEPLAYDVGVFTLRTFENGQEIRSGEGKFVVVVRKLEDDSWKFQVDGYSDIK